ncbi:hypothetical protein K1W54_11125 [Micromonospora sp. CPCC 205371]|nr:hypothetical protein [Micromonospora sp. CPCC 205371]
MPGGPIGQRPGQRWDDHATASSTPPSPALPATALAAGGNAATARLLSTPEATGASPDLLADLLTRAGNTQAHGLMVYRSGDGDGASARTEKSDPNQTVPFAVHFDRPLTGEEFIAVANAQLKVDPATVTWQNVKDRYDPANSPVTVQVSVDIIRRARSTATAAEVGMDVDASGGMSGAAERAGLLLAMPEGAEKQSLYTEIDRRYWQATGIPDGHKIISRDTEPGKAALWDQIRDEVLAQRSFVGNLPPKARILMHEAARGLPLGPRDYEQVVRVANKIEKMSVEDLENYLREVSTTTDLTAFERAVDTFLASKEAAKGQIDELLSKAAEDGWDVDTEAAKLDAKAMFYLSLADRIKLIGQLAGGYVVGDEDEQTIVRLLTSTPSGDLAALLEHLKSSESALLKKLESAIDGEENKQYYAALRNVLFRSMEPEQAQQKMASAKILPWADPGIIKATYNVRFHYETVEYTEEGKVRVVFWTNFLGMGLKNQEQIFEPDEIIGLHFFLDEDFADASKGETIYMPAANLIAFKNKQFSRELGLAVDVGLLFAGGAGLLAKGTRLTKAIAVLDTALAVADITINSYRAEIAETDGGKSFLRAWDTVNTLIAVYGLGRIVLRLPEVFRNLRKAYQEFRASSNDIPAKDVDKIDNEVGKLLDEADNAAVEGDLDKLRGRFPEEQLQAFEAQLDKAAGISDASRRQAAIATVESQVEAQQANAARIAELQAANPTATRKEIADLAAPGLRVPSVPMGMDADEFQRAQDLIRRYLTDNGLAGTEGFATGSRVTGVTMNPKKAATFGKPGTDFGGKDLDITLITPRAMTRSEIRKLEELYSKEFKHPLGIRNVFDRRELDHIPVYGKIDLDLK